MAYDDLKQESGRRPVYIMVLYLDRCVNEYGVVPCTASGPGATKCFNTLSTCQDLPNFDRGGDADRKTYAFSSTRIDNWQDQASSFIEGDPPLFPTVMAVQTTPTLLTPGKGLGVRSTVSVKLTDHPWTDIGIDPYLSERNYNPDDSGSLWGRLLARNEFYEGRRMDILTGYLDEDGLYQADNFVRRTYIIHRIAGPDASGMVTVEGKDPLKFADSDRKQWPRQSLAELDADITDAQTAFDITDDGTIEDNYNNGQPWIRVDDEAMEVTNVVDNGGGSYTLTVNRATLPSIYDDPEHTAEEHSAESTIQGCWYFDEVRIDDLVYFLLNTGAGIDASFLPLSDWQQVIDAGLQNYLLSALLTEALGVKQLLQEICELNILLWWDERDQEVQMDALIPGRVTAGPYTDDVNIVKDSVSVSKDVKSRLSQIWVIFGDRNPIRDRDKVSTYRRIETRSDLDAETPEEYGDSRVRRIWSRWLPLDKRSVAGEIGSRLLIEYRDTKTVLAMTLDPKDDDQWTGDLLLVETRYVQGIYGGAANLGYRILEVNEQLSMEGVRYKYVMQEAAQLQRIGVITPNEDPENPGNSFPDYTPASDALKNQYAFIGYDDGTGPPPEPLPFPDGTPPYQIQ